MSISRRRVLKGLGGIAVALPWLEKFHDASAWAQASMRPKRVVVVTYQMGVPIGAWRPGANLTLPFVTAPLEPFKNRCLFVSDIDNTVLDRGGNSFVFGHPGKSEAALTGTFVTGAFPTTNANLLSELRTDATTTGGANSESIEQRIGASLLQGHPFSSVDLCVDGDRRQVAVASRFFYESRGTPVSMQGSPSAALNRYFAMVMPGNMAAEQALRELRLRNKSVLDAVRGSFNELKTGLGTDDRRRLEEHAARIRQIELLPPPTMSCARPTVPTIPAMPKMDVLAAPQLQLMAQAMACNLAPVGRLEFVNQQNPRFGNATLDATLDAAQAAGMYDWHAMVHGDPLPGTPATAFLRPGRDASVTTYDMRMLEGYRFFVTQFAELLRQLDGLAEGPGTSVLDNSLVILATDLGEGQGHGHMKMGYVLAGNLGAAKRNFHFNASPPNANFYTRSNFCVSQLLNSILDMASVTAPGGGPVPEFGLQGFLAAAGIPRRIDALFG